MEQKKQNQDNERRAQGVSNRSGETRRHDDDPASDPGLLGREEDENVEDVEDLDEGADTNDTSDRKGGSNPGDGQRPTRSGPAGRRVQ
jgi:hypothetical protein